MTRQFQHPNNQHGVTLIISLVFLLLLTMLGLATMRSTTMQERMANNIQDRMMAFQAAEAALRAGERAVAGFAAKPVDVNPPSGSRPGPGQVWQRNTIEWESTNWWHNHGIAYGNNGANGSALIKQLSASPRYVIEYIGFVPASPGVGHQTGKPAGRYFYRITAHGTGLTDNAQVILQSTTARRFY